MHKLSKLASALLLGALISLPAMAAEKAKPAATGTVATVNGVAIPQSIANAFVAEQKAQGAPDSPELKKAVREELIRRELLVQEAKKLGLDKNPDVAAQADLARQAIFIRAFVQDFVKKHPLRNMRIHGESSPQFSGCQDICTVRKTRSGCGIMIVKRPSSVVTAVKPPGEPFGLYG
jgi:peptidyl-prolyl cis-trans isomerase C